MTRRLAALASLAALAAGCSLGGEAEASRVDRCVDRVLTRVDPEHLTPRHRPVTERYVRKTYCERFAQEGWVNDDGTLSIDAHRWLLSAGETDCEVAVEPGEPPSDAPCPEQPEPTLECALLHHVPKEEVRPYLREVERERRVPVRCDDGTPLEELGVG
jgi:hypothetical protein